MYELVHRGAEVACEYPLYGDGVVSTLRAMDLTSSHCYCNIDLLLELAAYIVTDGSEAVEPPSSSSAMPQV